MAILAAVLWLLLFPMPSEAHNIYFGVHGKDQTLCCGGNDCNIVPTRETSQGAEFYIGDDGTENTPSKWKGMKPSWVFVSDLISYIPIPGAQAAIDKLPPLPAGEEYGHFCGRHGGPHDKPEQLIQGWWFYCAFIRPGGV